MNIRSAIATAVLVLTLCDAAQAQQAEQRGQAGQTGQTGHAGQTGILVMYPAAVGLIFRVSEGLALRPDFSFSTSASDYSNPGTTTLSKVDTYTLGISALVYVQSWQTVRVYVVPRFGYARTTNGRPAIYYVGTTYSGSGSLGVQYVFDRRLGIFAEGGINYDYKTTDADGTTISRTWSSRAVLGATLYF
jgi:hypothetical protein